MVREQRADVLLVTVTRVETLAVLAAFGKAGEHADPHSIDGRVYFDLGTVNGARIRLTQSEMGSGGLGASLQAVSKGIAALSPAAIIMVGIAFGVSENSQRTGDVLVSERLRPYDLQRVGTQEGCGVKIILRDDKPHASPWLLNMLRSSEVTWKGAELWFGTILTGAKLVDNLDFREQLRALEPEAIGGEMEGAGLYVACHDQKIDWILVKAICDFADGQKAKEKVERQNLAAKNAAVFVYHAFNLVKVDWEARHRERHSASDHETFETPARVPLRTHAESTNRDAADAAAARLANQSVVLAQIKWQTLYRCIVVAAIGGVLISFFGMVAAALLAATVGTILGMSFRKFGIVKAKSAAVQSTVSGGSATGLATTTAVSIALASATSATVAAFTDRIRSHSDTAEQGPPSPLESNSETDVPTQTEDETGSPIDEDDVSPPATATASSSAKPKRVTVREFDEKKALAVLGSADPAIRRCLEGYGLKDVEVSLTIPPRGGVTDAAITGYSKIQDWDFSPSGPTYCMSAVLYGLNFSPFDGSERSVTVVYSRFESVRVLSNNAVEKPRRRPRRFGYSDASSDN